MFILFKEKVNKISEGFSLFYSAGSKNVLT